MAAIIKILEYKYLNRPELYKAFDRLQNGKYRIPNKPLHSLFGNVLLYFSEKPPYCP